MAIDFGHRYSGVTVLPVMAAEELVGREAVMANHPLTCSHLRRR